MFSDYLQDRKQLFLIDGLESGEETVIFGVLQGIVLGPTLFLIYFNDLCDLPLPNCKVNTYTDDTALLVHSQSWQGLRDLSENTQRTET